MSNEPKWMTLAREEIGTKELPGKQHESRIIEYHAVTTLGAKSDEVPWCASFVGWALCRAGERWTRSAMARSYMDYGVALREPKVGAVVVIKRGAAPKGHVGFYVGGFDPKTDKEKVLLLGGNQSDAVSIAEFPMEDVLAIRWPTRSVMVVRKSPVVAMLACALLSGCAGYSVRVEGFYGKGGGAVEVAKLERGFAK